MDAMTPRERIDAAIALQPVDRVPVVPLLDLFALRYQGIKLATAVKNPDLGLAALVKTLDDLGGVDATGLPNGAQSELGFAPTAPIPSKLPGFELGEDDLWQLDEREIMTVEDYDWVLQNGWPAFLVHAFPRLGSHIPPEKFPLRVQQGAAQLVKDIQAWDSRGVPVLFINAGSALIERLSYTRSIKQLTLDLFRRPEKVDAVLERMEQEAIPRAVAMVQAVRSACDPGPRLAMIGGVRAGLFSPKQFDRFFWPYLKRHVQAFLDAGITPLLHFDSSWDHYLDHFLELPRGQMVLELDSATDIFKAKQILKGHMCLMGDVPASLLTLGTPEAVTSYVKKLIDVVGEDGGFILSTGCECPIDAKPENVRAMIDAGKSYYPHHKAF